MQAFAPLYQQEMRAKIEEAGLLNHWYTLALARGAAPEPLTLQRYCQLFPYNHPDLLAERLDSLARQKWLKPDKEGGYQLSRKGRRIVEQLFRSAQKRIGTVDLLTQERMAHYAQLLEQVVHAALDAQQPEDKWALRLSRWADPGKSAPPAVRIEQYLTDLVRFRDDVHIACWSKYPVSAQAFEAFTMVCRQEADTPDSLAETLGHRGYSAEDYTQALIKLAAINWVEQTLKGFQATEKGMRIRADIENETDRLYALPMLCLREEEIVALTRGLDDMVQELDTVCQTNS